MQNYTSGCDSINISTKYILTVEEASKYFGIGISKLRALMNVNGGASWILENGNRKCIKRKLFEEYLDNARSI